MKTREIHIGDRVIGGGNPILIQSMTNTKTSDVEATVAQILQLEKAGCDIIRCTINDEAAADAIPAIKKQIHIPVSYTHLTLPTISEDRRSWQR